MLDNDSCLVWALGAVLLIGVAGYVLYAHAELPQPPRMWYNVASVAGESGIEAPQAHGFGDRHYRLGRLDRV